MDSPRAIEKRNRNFFIRYCKVKQITFAIPNKEIQFIFLNGLTILTKTEILLSSSVVVFSYYIVIFFNILLCFVFDLDSGFCSVHVQNVTLLFFFFFRKILIRSPSYFRLFFFFFRKILVPFTCLFSKPYFVFPIIFSFAFLNI